MHVWGMDKVLRMDEVWWWVVQVLCLAHLTCCGMRGVGGVCVWLGAAWMERGGLDERIGFGLYHSCGNRGVLDVYLCCGGVDDRSRYVYIALGYMCILVVPGVQ